MRAAAFFLLACLVLAGCSGPPGLERDNDSGGTGGSGGPGGDGGTGGGDGTDLPPTTVAPRAAMLLGFSIEGCSGVETLAHVDAELARAVVPAGYNLTTDDLPPGETATVQYVWASCADLRTPAARVNATVLGFVGVRIEAPADALEADEHWYRLRMLAQDDLLSALWNAAGYEVVTGAYSATSQAPLVPGAPRDFDVRLGDYVVQGAATAAFGDGPVRTAYYTDAPGGRLEWEGTYTPSAFEGMTGTFAVAADDPLAAAFVPPAAPRLEQRHLSAADWTDTDLWLRSTG